MGNKDNNIGSLRDLKKPTFIAIKVSREDVNKVFRKDVKGNFALFDHISILIAIKTLSIRNI